MSSYAGCRFSVLIQAGQAARIFDIANVAFDSVPSDEKLRYTAQIKERGSYQGYKPRQFWVGCIAMIWGLRR